MEEIWITGNDIMSVAKIYNLTYQEAIDHITSVVEAMDKKAIFV